MEEPVLWSRWVRGQRDALEAVNNQADARRFHQLRPCRRGEQSG